MKQILMIEVSPEGRLGESRGSELIASSGDWERLTVEERPEEEARTDAPD
jgi:hypothetical protein